MWPWFIWEWSPCPEFLESKGEGETSYNVCSQTLPNALARGKDMGAEVFNFLLLLHTTWAQVRGQSAFLRNICFKRTSEFRENRRKKTKEKQNQTTMEENKFSVESRGVMAPAHTPSTWEEAVAGRSAW